MVAILETKTHNIFIANNPISMRFASKSAVFHYFYSELVCILYSFPIEMLREGIMQDVYTFAGTDQCQLPEYDPYSYM